MVPISMELMVTTGTKHAVNCGDFHEAWREWRQTPTADQTWANWMTHWMRALQENHDIQKITGVRANQLINGLDDLANAAVQKNETIEKLISTNQQKDQVIASLTKSLKEEKRTKSTLLAIIGGASLRPGGGDNSFQRTGGKWEANLDLNGYCWLHGYKVKMGHSSMTCNKRL
ncbi:hypothetical protein ACHAW6_007859 [Cyclotella cf. meneghiniana]